MLCLGNLLTEGGTITHAGLLETAGLKAAVPRHNIKMYVG